MSVRSNWLRAMFSSAMSLMIFCLLDLWITDRGVLKSPTVIVNLHISGLCNEYSFPWICCGETTPFLFYEIHFLYLLFQEAHTIYTYCNWMVLSRKQFSFWLNIPAFSWKSMSHLQMYFIGIILDVEDVFKSKLWQCVLFWIPSGFKSFFSLTILFSSYLVHSLFAPFIPHLL